MALKGADISATYQDWVHVNKAGAGLADHLGAEAALYLDDGAGGVDQICGRTAVRHWLDPHPDAAAFAETFEFSTTGDMTQGALETAGWTFSNCTAVVANGTLILTMTANAVALASLDVSFAGDFDVCITPVSTMQYFAASTAFPNYHIGGGGVADYRDGVADVAHYGIVWTGSSNIPAYSRFSTGAYTTLGGSEEADNVYTPYFVRIYRYSGTLEIPGASASFPQWNMIADDSSPNGHGFTNNAAIADSSTFNKLFITQTNGAASSGSKIAIANIRRFQ